MRPSSVGLRLDQFEKLFVDAWSCSEYRSAMDGVVACDVGGYAAGFVDDWGD